MIEALVVNKLLRWARWKMQTGVALGYPSQVTYYRMPHITEPYFRDPGIDADCMITDKAVMLLPEVYKLVIRLEYIDAIPSIQQKAHCYGKAIRTYQLDRSTAYMLLGNLLDTLIKPKQEEAA